MKTIEAQKYDIMKRIVLRWIMCLRNMVFISNIVSNTIWLYIFQHWIRYPILIGKPHFIKFPTFLVGYGSLFFVFFSIKWPRSSEKNSITASPVKGQKLRFLARFYSFFSSRKGHFFQERQWGEESLRESPLADASSPLQRT